MSSLYFILLRNIHKMNNLPNILTITSAILFLYLILFLFMDFLIIKEIKKNYVIDYESSK